MGRGPQRPLGSAPMGPSLLPTWLARSSLSVACRLLSSTAIWSSVALHSRLLRRTLSSCSASSAWAPLSRLSALRQAVTTTHSIRPSLWSGPGSPSCTPPSPSSTWTVEGCRFGAAQVRCTGGTSSESGHRQRWTQEPLTPTPQPPTSADRRQEGRGALREDSPSSLSATAFCSCLALEAAWSLSASISASC